MTLIFRMLVLIHLSSIILTCYFSLFCFPLYLSSTQNECKMCPFTASFGFSYFKHYYKILIITDYQYVTTSPNGIWRTCSANPPAPIFFHAVIYVLFRSDSDIFLSWFLCHPPLFPHGQPIAVFITIILLWLKSGYITNIYQVVGDTYYLF